MTITILLYSSKFYFVYKHCLSWVGKLSRYVWCFLYIFQLRFDFTANSIYELFKEPTAKQVAFMYEEHEKSWFNFWPVQQTEVSLSLFNGTCVGVATKERYTIFVEQRGMINGLFVGAAVWAKWNWLHPCCITHYYFTEANITLLCINCTLTLSRHWSLVNWAGIGHWVTEETLVPS